MFRQNDRYLRKNKISGVAEERANGSTHASQGKTHLTKAGVRRRTRDIQPRQGVAGALVALTASDTKRRLQDGGTGHML